MVILRREEVLIARSMLIGGGQGKAEEIFENTDNFITETKAPNVKKERKKLALGVIKGRFGLEGMSIGHNSPQLQDKVGF